MQLISLGYCTLLDVADTGEIVLESLWRGLPCQSWSELFTKKKKIKTINVCVPVKDKILYKIVT